MSLECKCCGKIKPDWHFQWKPSTGGLNSRTCEDCRRYNTRILNALKKKHKPRKNQCCQVCGISITESGKANLDHCHKTGRFRGWLCKECNMAIGLLGDTKMGVSKALKYLIKVAIKQKLNI